MTEDSAHVSTGLVAVLVVLALAAGVVLGAAIRQTIRAREWSSTALMAAAVMIATPSYVGVIVTFSHQWATTVDIHRNVSSTLPAWATPLMRVTLAALLVAAIYTIVIRVRRKDAYVSIPALLIAVVALMSVGSSLLSGDNPFRPYTVVFVVVLLATAVAPRGLGVHLGIGSVAVGFAVVSGLALWLNSSFAAISCNRGEKCGYFGFLFRGVLDNENALALLLALSIPYVFMAFRGWRGVVLCSFMVVLAVMSGSRSGATAAVIAFAVLIVVFPDVRNPQRSRWRWSLVGAVLAVAFAIGITLPFLPHDPSDFSGRAYLWQLALRQLEAVNLWFGTGVLGWSNMHSTGVVDSSAEYSVHNQWMSILQATGICGLVIFIVAIALLLWESRHEYFAVVGCALVPVFVLAITERPWPVDTMDWLTWVGPAALLCYPASRSRKDIDASGVGDVALTGPMQAGLIEPRAVKAGGLTGGSLT